ncbi:DUF4360 domain-containing protein [Cryptosporangium sp. NPDC051539]|uniref:DUF4360 domain-containing protein n=1 Tax=Cryptosporangium sp. NPDC051539 TaxID=3363962 RepID=UPI00379D7326
MLRDKPVPLVALAAPLLAGALTFPGTADGAVPPPAGRFVVQSINGTGCHAADTQVRPHGLTGLDVGFDALAARQGGGASALDRRRQCLVTIQAVVGRGWSFGIDSILLRGQASLPAGATGTAIAQSWFAGQTNTGAVDRRLTGPFTGRWELRGPVRPASVAWMPCSASYPLNLQVEARVAGARPGRVTLDTGTAEPSASYHFAWRRC